MIIVPTSSANFASYERIEVTVGKVFDGDGFLGAVRRPSSTRPHFQIPFRLAFIDAPEIGQPYGQESKAFLHRLLVGKSPQLVLICKQSNGNLPIDPYKRVLCMAFVEDQIAPGAISYYWQGQCASGTARRSRSVVRNVELEMIVNGWAWVLEQYAFEHEGRVFCRSVRCADQSPGFVGGEQSGAAMEVQKAREKTAASSRRAEPSDLMPLD